MANTISYACTEPSGLPGTTIERIEFQRAPEGRLLDDMIVHAHDACGVPAVREIQVKRSITAARPMKGLVGVIFDRSDASP